MTESSSLYQIRRLSIALLLSGACNILCIAYIIYAWINEIPSKTHWEQRPAVQQEQEVAFASEQSNREVIRHLRTFSFQELVTELENTELVENGYTRRDLALACLVTLHHFDLPKALFGSFPPHQPRTLILGKNGEGKWLKMAVFPGLSEEHYQAISRFARTERWPLTSQGLYVWLCKQKEKTIDPTLVDAFLLTPEFLSVEILLCRTKTPIEKQELMRLLVEGNWTLLKSFFDRQCVAQDLTPARRQRFLLDYVSLGSKTAAYLMLKTDGEFALKKLDDARVLALLKLLDEKTPETAQYALQLLTSPRSDGVWQLAASRLFEYAGESKPEQGLHHAALLRFLPQTADVQKHEPAILQSAVVTQAPPSKEAPKVQVASPKPISQPKTTAPIIYVVQEGDSLWKISRRFQVDVEMLRTYNGLKTDCLKPGTMLKIPPRKK